MGCNMSAHDPDCQLMAVPVAGVMLGTGLMQSNAAAQSEQANLLCGTRHSVTGHTAVDSYADAAIHVVQESGSKTQAIIGCEILEMYLKCCAYKGM